MWCLLPHRWTKTVILPGCRERLDCADCGAAGKIQAAHSWGPWEVFDQSIQRQMGYVMVSGIQRRQRRNCLRCNYCEEESVA